MRLSLQGDGVAGLRAMLSAASAEQTRTARVSTVRACQTRPPNQTSRGSWTPRSSSD